MYLPHCVSNWRKSRTIVGEIHKRPFSTEARNASSSNTRLFRNFLIIIYYILLKAHPTLKVSQEKAAWPIVGKHLLIKVLLIMIQKATVYLVSQHITWNCITKEMRLSCQRQITVCLGRLQVCHTGLQSKNAPHLKKSVYAECSSNLDFRLLYKKSALLTFTHIQNLSSCRNQETFQSEHDSAQRKCRFFLFSKLVMIRLLRWYTVLSYQNAGI